AWQHPALPPAAQARRARSGWPPRQRRRRPATLAQAGLCRGLHRDGRAGRIQNQWEAQHQRRAVSELRCHLQGAPVGEVQQHYRVSAVSERVPIGYAKAAKRVKNTVTPTSVQVSTDLNCGRSVASVTTSYIGKMRPMPSNVYMAIPRLRTYVSSFTKCKGVWTGPWTSRPPTHARIAARPSILSNDTTLRYPYFLHSEFRGIREHVLETQTSNFSMVRRPRRCSRGRSISAGGPTRAAPTPAAAARRSLSGRNRYAAAAERLHGFLHVHRHLDEVRCAEAQLGRGE
ncbi:unnamed protein product, partial [Prorocentrum cordatum]